MERITQKFHYNMKNILILTLLLLLSCKKENKSFQQGEKKNILEIKDTLKKIKDTTLFINSSEGEEVTFFVNEKNNDSIINSEIFGETGKSEYHFVFNKTFKEGTCKIYRYDVPIYANPNPKIELKKIESLTSSKESYERLNSIYSSYRNILFFKKNNKPTKSKWYGKYSVTLNENNDDWKDIHEIELNISKDSITYLAKGFQLYQLYLLSSEEKNTSIKLKYKSSLDNTDSWVLEKTKDFGIISYNGKDYLWESPYLDMNFNKGKKQKYILQKLK